MDTLQRSTLRYAVLPPEASTNWLFDENVLFHLLLRHRGIYMDITDYFRYKRLAAHSDMDLIKYFLLTLLKRIKILHLLNYRSICSQQTILKTLEAIKDKNFLRDTKRHEVAVRSGYIWYLKYIAGKEKILPAIGCPSADTAYDREKTTAEAHLLAMTKGRFLHEDRRPYLRRLATKLMTAQTVCKAVNGVIFDSREYNTGVTLLKKYGLLSQRTVFDSKLFSRSASFHKLLSFCEKEGYMNLGTGITQTTPTLLRIWLPYAFMERLATKDSNLVSTLQSELVSMSKRELREEVEEYIQSNRSTLGGVEKYKHIANAVDTAVGVVPVAGQISAIYKMFRSILAAHNQSKVYASNAAQLIGIALATEMRVANIDLRYRVMRRYRIMRSWISWLEAIFRRQSSEEDQKWILSQREMGVWTETGIYVPWYEHSEEQLQYLGLN